MSQPTPDPFDDLLAAAMRARPVRSDLQDLAQCAMARAAALDAADHRRAALLRRVRWRLSLAHALAAVALLGLGAWAMVGGDLSGHVASLVQAEPDADPVAPDWTLPPAPDDLLPVGGLCLAGAALVVALGNAPRPTT
jgi:hypothetical protein